MPNFAKGIGLGGVSGILSGWLSIGVNKITDVFPFEQSLLSLFVSFAVGGAIFGIIAGSVMAVASEFSPGASYAKAIIICVGLWVVLRLGGAILSYSDPLRYHESAAQTIQGLVMAVALGGILGVLWDLKRGR